MPIDSIRERLSRLDVSISTLKEIISLGRPAIESNRIYLGAAKFYLIEAIQICLDIGNSIIGKKGWEKPTSYAEIFTTLSKHNLFSQEFAAHLAKMAAFRNRLVHSYIDFDNTLLLDILESELDDLIQFAKIIELKFFGDP